MEANLQPVEPFLEVFAKDSQRIILDARGARVRAAWEVRAGTIVGASEAYYRKQFLLSYTDFDDGSVRGLQRMGEIEAEVRAYAVRLSLTPAVHWVCTDFVWL